MLWKDAGYVFGSPLCKKIIKCLNSAERPLTPLEISGKTSIARSNVSTKLGELRKRGIVICLNPEIKKWLSYKLTPKGKRVVGEIEKIERSLHTQI